MDRTYHYYLSGPSVLEERNGSDQRIKQCLPGGQYVDELVQEAINTNPTGTASWAYPTRGGKR
jgi:hypothetical protein